MNENSDLDVAGGAPAWFWIAQYPLSLTNAHVPNPFLCVGDSMCADKLDELLDGDDATVSLMNIFVY